MTDPTRSFVEWIDDVRIEGMVSGPEQKKLLRELGARRELFGRRWKLRFSSEQELAKIFSALRDAGFAFAGGPSGWPPAEVFRKLRRGGYLTGGFTEVTWRGPEDMLTIEHGDYD